jgi:hypothetical protein
MPDIIDLPNIIPSKCSWIVIPSSQADFNPYSKIEQVSDEPGEKWQVKLEWKNLPHTYGRDIRGALMALRGQVNQLRVKDFAHSNIGSFSGIARVKGSSQYGIALLVDGLTENSTVGRIGDRFQLGKRVHELTQNAVTNGSGEVTLKFVPEIMIPPADNVALTLTEPKGLFIMKDPKQIPDFSHSVRVFKSISITLIESLR